MLRLKKMGVLKEDLTASEDNFWKGIKIYCKKPNSINKEVLYSEKICSYKTSSEITQKECQLWCKKLYDDIFVKKMDYKEVHKVFENVEKFTLSDNIEYLNDMNCNYIIVRKLQPKKSSDCDKEFYELCAFDMKAKKVMLFSLFDKSFAKSLDTEIYDPLIVVKYDNINVYYENNLLIVEFDDNMGEKGKNWINSVFLKKLKKIILSKSENKVHPVMKFSSQVNVIKYYKLYDRLKLKYAKDLIENWSESTDPKKFVFEDIAISTYLLLLWNKGEIPDENSEKQKFYDLGCGNGLLVYILNSEGHKGIGLDVKKRKIWETYPSNVILREEAVVPGPTSVFPDADWLIGNHSDELTPWLPIMARRSGIQCQYFALPCCPFQLNGQIYQRKNSGLSVYHDFIQYVKKISEVCKFETFIDKLRIPSTKRICLIGRKNYISSENLTLISKDIDYFIAKESFIPNDASAETEKWIKEFKVRQAFEPVRNCTRLPRDLIQKVLFTTANALLKQKNMIKVQKGNETCLWNQGGSVQLRELADSLSQEQLKHLKKECKGLQTLIKNHHYVFSVCEGLVRFKNIEEIMKISQNALKNRAKFKWKQKECWFNINHPDGCPLPDEVCSYKHR